MTAYKIDPKTANGDIGIFITKTGAITPSDTVPIGHLCTLIKCKTVAGDIAVKNSITGEINIWPIEAGETVAIIYDQVMATNTTATGLYWAVTGNYIDNDYH